MGFLLLVLASFFLVNAFALSLKALKRDRFSGSSLLMKSDFDNKNYRKIIDTEPHPLQSRKWEERRVEARLRLAKGNDKKSTLSSSLKRQHDRMLAARVGARGALNAEKNSGEETARATRKAFRASQVGRLPRARFNEDVKVGGGTAPQ